jgi:hypothetical protein
LVQIVNRNKQGITGIIGREASWLSDVRRNEDSERVRISGYPIMPWVILGIPSHRFFVICLADSAKGASYSDGIFEKDSRLVSSFQFEDHVAKNQSLRPWSLTRVTAWGIDPATVVLLCEIFITMAEPKERTSRKTKFKSETRPCDR